MTRFSVVLPYYNHAKYLEQCIESVIYQSRLPDEFFIIDDGSTDHGFEIIEHYAKKYPFIRYSRHPQNMGLHATLHELFLNTIGDRVWSLAADDALLPGILEKMEQVHHEHPDVGLILAKHINVPESWDYWSEFSADTGVSNWGPTGYLNPKQFLSKVLTEPNGVMAFGMSTMFLKSKLILNEYIFPEAAHLHDVFARLCVGARAGVYFIDQPGQVFRSVEGSLCRTKDKEDWIQVLKVIYERMSSNFYRELFGSGYAETYIHAILKELEIEVSGNLSDFFNSRINPKG